MEITMTAALEVDPSTISSYALVRTGIADWILRAAAALRDLGPYAAIELLLPGGSLVILLLWLYRRHKKSAAAVALPGQSLGRSAEYCSSSQKKATDRSPVGSMQPGRAIGRTNGVDWQRFPRLPTTHVLTLAQEAFTMTSNSLRELGVWCCSPRLLFFAWTAARRRDAPRASMITGEIR